MKVNFKRVATAALAVAMSLSLNVSAFAEGTNVTSGQLTVTGDQLAGKYVYAIQMFEARAQEGDGAYTFDSYELIDVWEGFFRDETYFTDQDWKAAGVIKESETASAAITDYSDAALAYVEWLADENQEEKLMTFANNAKKWAESKDVFTRTYGADDQASVLKDVTVSSAWTSYAYVQKANKVDADETKGTANFASLNTGYYLVYPEGGSTGKAGATQGVYTEAARGTDAMLINIPTNAESTTWNIKSTYPTVDKTVDTDNDGNGEAADNGSAQVGDTVTFTLTSKVPDMTDYNEFYFAFNDTMSKGLEFVQKTPNEDIEADDVTVKIDGVEVDTGYTVTLTGKKLKVEFKNLKNVPGAITGATITVTYQAKITKDAVSTGDSILGTAENEANVEYSNDPNGTGHGTSTPDESKVYTYQIGVHKYTGDWSSSAPCLPGAKFVLSKKDTLTGTSPDYIGDEGVIKLVGGDNEYCVATADDGENTTYEFITNNTGEIVIKGLEAGTYYLHEVAAPDGYNKLKEPIKITISVSGETASLEAPVYTIGSTANAANDDTVGVQNKQGIELPETGSIGTIGLTALGVVVVVAGLFAFPRKKKTRQD